MPYTTSLSPSLLHPLGLLELSSSFCENNDSQKPSIPTHYKSSLGLKINDST